MNPKELRENAGKIFREMKALLAKVENENRNFTTEEQAQFDNWEKQHDDLISRAERIEVLNQRETELGRPANAGGLGFASNNAGQPGGQRHEPRGGQGGSASNNSGLGNGSLPGGEPRVINHDDGMRGFRNEREFLECVMTAGRGGRVDDRLRALDVDRIDARNAVGSDEHSTQNDPYGGFLVPESMLPGWLRTEPEPDPMLGRTTQVPLETPIVKVPARVDKDHSTSVSGGLTVTRRMETGTGSASRMKMEQVRLEASSLFGLSYVTEELISDSPRTIAALLSQGFQDEFRSHIIGERISGTGAGEFMGILNSPCLVSVAKEENQTADTINGANILKMRMRCWRYGQAVWLYNPDCYEQLAKVHIAGTNGDVFLFNPARGIDVPDMILGRPAFPSEYCNTLGDQGDLILGNWSQYLEGTYQPLQSAESMHVRFENHERVFKFSLRNAGAPWWRSALTPKNSAVTLSPFVVLAERAG